MSSSPNVSELTNENAAIIRRTWSAIGSLTLCVSLLIASEFLPVSLLTPIAADLNATAGQAGQAISISGLFAVATSLFGMGMLGKLNRKHVMLGMTLLMLISMICIAEARSFEFLMAARAILGVTIGGFWSLSTATVMRLVPPQQVSRALGVVYTGNAIATAFAAPIGSYLGNFIGWRGVFWVVTPLIVVNLIWQWVSLPTMPQKTAASPRSPISLLKHRHVAIAMLAAMCSFSGAFCVFTYFRPFLEQRLHVGASTLSILLLTLGLAGFVGTSVSSRFVGRHLRSMLFFTPLLLAVVTSVTYEASASMWLVGIVFVFWGALNSAVPILWSNWLAVEGKQFPESAGGLFVGCVQLSIMLGAEIGGKLLDNVSFLATFTCGTALLLAAGLLVGRGNRIYNEA
jgi:predicted MFS family arabinose efflux permease